MKKIKQLFPISIMVLTFFCLIDFPALALSPDAIYSRYHKSVPTVVTQQDSLGASARIGKNFLLTNAHVVAADDLFKVINEDVELKIGKKVIGTARVIAIDAGKDLALLKLNSRIKGKIISLGRNSKQINIGEAVYAIGSPFGLSQSIANGIISGVRESKVDASVSFIQSSVPLNSGNSGGPLLDKNGKLVGINSMTISKSVGEGIGFSISIETIKRFLNSIPRYRKVGNSRKLTIKCPASVCTANSRLVLQKTRKSITDISGSDDHGLSVDHEYFATFLFFDNIKPVRVKKGKYHIIVYDPIAEKAKRFTNVRISRNKTITINSLDDDMDTDELFAASSSSNQGPSGSELTPKETKGTSAPSRKYPRFKFEFTLDFAQDIDDKRSASDKDLHFGLNGKFLTNIGIYKSFYYGVGFKYIAVQNFGNSIKLTGNYSALYVALRFYTRKARKGGVYFLSNIGYTLDMGPKDELLATGGIGYTFVAGINESFSFPLEFEVGTIIGINFGFTYSFN